MSPEEIRAAAEDLHKRGAAIHLGRLLDCRVFKQPKSRESPPERNNPFFGRNSGLLCLMWWDDVCSGMALDADRKWDFPSLPVVEKRAISIFQLCSAGRARVRSPRSVCRVYKFDECLGRETVAHLKSFFAFPYFGLPSLLVTCVT
jgi:hypothetical protein